jgi:hypothetical protein
VAENENPGSGITLSRAEYEQLIAVSREYEQLQADIEEASRQDEEERLSLIQDFDTYKAETEAQRRAWAERETAAQKRAAEIEGNWHKAEKARALTSALSGFDFVDDKARAHIAAILDSKFEAKAGADGVGVYEAGTGRGIADAIKEMLPSEFAYALKPTTTGGSGATQTRQGNGAAGLAGQFVVDRQKLNDPAYMQANQGKIAEAAQAGTLLWN